MVMGGGPRPSTIWGTLRFFLSELNLLVLQFEKNEFTRQLQLFSPPLLLTQLSYAFPRLFQIMLMSSYT